MPNETYYLSYGQGKTSYRVNIPNLTDEIQKCKPCEIVDLRKFYAHDDRSQFQLAVFPNGAQENQRGYVSMFLLNTGNKTLHCDWEIKISWSNMSGTQKIVINGENEYFRRGEQVSSEWNILKKGCKIMEHSIFSSWSWMEKTSMEIECSVSNILIESDENIFCSSRKNAFESLASKLASIDSKISNIELKNQETLTNLQLQNKKIALKLEEKSKDIPAPECPVCLEPLNKSPKIAQCVLGHLLCWNCKQRPELEDCPSCRGPICGRAFGMENYLKTLFPAQGEFQFLADRAGQGAVVNVDDESRIGG